MRGTVVIFVKAPRAGAVKTRLGQAVGAGRAAFLFRILIDRTVAEATQGPWRTMIAIDPPSAVKGWNHLFPPHLPRIAQCRGDHGERMARAFLSAPPGPVVMIGADAPGVRARHLREAFRALSGADAVFGPAADGGYWLVGLARRRHPPLLFERVRWSTKHTLADTLKTLPADFRVALLETLADVDTAADLKAFGPRATAR